MEIFRFDLALALSLAAVGLAATAVSWLAARALAVPLRRAQFLLALATAAVVAAPYVITTRVFAPTLVLSGQLPRQDPFPVRPVSDDPHDAERNDAVFQFLPWELEVRRAFRQVRLPLWSDRIDGGSDLWANLQAQPLSPVAWLARPLQLQHFLLASQVAKVVLGLLGCLVLARRFGIRRPWASVAALSFTLGGAISPWAVFPHSAAAVWAPWVAAGVLSLARRPNRRAFVATALFTAALMLGGHPEVAASGVLFAALLGTSLVRARRVRSRTLAAPALAGLLGVALASVQWIPLVAAAAESQRATDQRNRTAPDDRWFEGGSNRYLVGLLHPSPTAAGPVSPDPFHGKRPGWSYAATIYPGLAALFGLTLLATRRFPRRVWPLLAFSSLVLLGLTDFAPLARLHRALPGLRMIEDSRFVPVAMLALSLAGALGLQALERARGRRARVVALASATTASMLAGPPAAVLAAWVALALAVASPARSARALVVAAAALDLIGFAWINLPRGRAEEFYPRSQLLDRWLAEQSAPGGPWRATGNDYLGYPAVLSVHGLEDFRAHNPLAPQAQLDALGAAFDYQPTSESYFQPLRHLEHPFACFLGVRTILTNEYLPSIPGMERIDVRETQPYALLRNPCALPRWFFPAAIETVERKQIRSWIAAMKDPRVVAVDPASLPSPAATPGFAPVVTASATAGSATLSFQPSGEARLLAGSVPRVRGWSATANGRELPLATVNGAYLGVVVPAGVDRVELQFTPPGFRWGVALSFGAIAALAWIAFGRSRRLDVFAS